MCAKSCDGLGRGCVVSRVNVTWSMAMAVVSLAADQRSGGSGRGEVKVGNWRIECSAADTDVAATTCGSGWPYWNCMKLSHSRDPRQPWLAVPRHHGLFFCGWRLCLLGGVQACCRTSVSGRPAERASLRIASGPASCVCLSALLPWIHGLLQPASSRPRHCSFA